jgi:hypothetical protein
MGGRLFLWRLGKILAFGLKTMIRAKSRDPWDLTDGLESGRDFSEKEGLRGGARCRIFLPNWVRQPRF